MSPYLIQISPRDLLGIESALSCCDNCDRMISTTYSFSKSYELGINVRLVLICSCFWWDLLAALIMTWIQSMVQLQRSARLPVLLLINLRNLTRWSLIRLLMFQQHLKRYCTLLSTDSVFYFDKSCSCPLYRSKKTGRCITAKNYVRAVSLFYHSKINLLIKKCNLK